MRRSNDTIIRLIGIFKLVKAALLVALGAGALSIIHDPPLKEWITGVAKDIENRPLNHLLSSVTSVDEHKLRGLGIASFIYASLFLVEGIGLLLRKGWAEYFTIVITTSFVPLEIYELVEKTSIVKILVLVVNLAVVGYLVWKLRRDHRWPFRR